MIDTGQRSFQRFSATKKPFRRKSQGRRDPPWYHLASHASSRKRPWGVPAHSCAVTCAHVVTYAQGGRPRNSETMFSKPFQTSFHHTRLSALYLPGYSSLHRLFAIRLFNNCLIVYLITPEKSTGQPAQKSGEKIRGSVSFHKAASGAVETGNFFKRRGSIGLQPLGKTAIIKSTIPRRMEEQR